MKKLTLERNLVNVMFIGRCFLLKLALAMCWSNYAVDIQFHYH